MEVTQYFDNRAFSTGLDIMVLLSVPHCVGAIYSTSQKKQCMMSINFEVSSMGPGTFLNVGVAAGLFSLLPLCNVT